MKKRGKGVIICILLISFISLGSRIHWLPSSNLTLLLLCTSTFSQESQLEPPDFVLKFKNAFIVAMSGILHSTRMHSLTVIPSRQFSVVLFLHALMCKYSSHVKGFVRIYVNRMENDTLLLTLNHTLVVPLPATASPL